MSAKNGKESLQFLQCCDSSQRKTHLKRTILLGHLAGFIVWTCDVVIHLPFGCSGALPDSRSGNDFILNTTPEQPEIGPVTTNLLFARGPFETFDPTTPSHHLWTYFTKPDTNQYRLGRPSLGLTFVSLWVPGGGLFF